jgi:hypothetical protein
LPPNEWAVAPSPVRAQAGIIVDMDDVGDDMPVGAPRGGGPGPITPDGCAVEVYTALPPQEEPDIISAAVPAGGTHDRWDGADMTADLEACDLRFDRFLSSDGAWLDVRAA